MANMNDDFTTEKQYGTNGNVLFFPNYNKIMEHSRQPCLYEFLSRNDIFILQTTMGIGHDLKTYLVPKGNGISFVKMIKEEEPRLRKEAGEIAPLILIRKSYCWNEKQIGMDILTDNSLLPDCPIAFYELINSKGKFLKRFHLGINEASAFEAKMKADEPKLRESLGEREQLLLIKETIAFGLDLPIEEQKYVVQLIHKFQLDDWWENVVSAEERHILEELYCPWLDNMSCLDFIMCIISWFTANNWYHDIVYYQLLIKLVNIGDEEAFDETDVFGKFLYYTEKINAFFSCRNSFADAENFTIKACEEHIAMSEETMIEFGNSYSEYSGYIVLCNIYEEHGKWQELLSLAEKAKLEGWLDSKKRGWNIRIKKAKKMLC